MGGERVAKSVAKRTSANETSVTKRPMRGRVVKLSDRAKQIKTAFMGDGRVAKGGQRTNETLEEVELNLGRSARNAFIHSQSGQGSHFCLA